MTDFRTFLTYLYATSFLSPGGWGNNFLSSHVNKTNFHKKGCTLGLILKVRVFGSQIKVAFWFGV